MNEIHPKLKKLIAKYLLRDLTKVEIIYYRDSIWFIDRENRYWYFEYHKVDKHLWWRWSHFTSALKIFSMDAETNQSIFGELINMILIKKQKLESKYPNQVFKTVGSVINFEVNDDVVPNNEVKTTEWQNGNLHPEVDEVLNCEVKTTADYSHCSRPVVDEVLNCEVKTTGMCPIDSADWVDEVLNCEVETTDGAFYSDEIVTNEVLNFEVEKIHEHRSTKGILVKDILEYSAETINHGELIDEDKFMDEVLSVDIKTIDYSKTHRLRPVTGALDLSIETTESVKGNLKYEVRNVLEHTIEINSIEKLKGENPFQDIVVGHILDESDKVTDKLVIKEEEYVKTFSHDVYMCDHLVQNVLDVGVNSIHYDAEPHTQLVDGILKKSYNL